MDFSGKLIVGLVILTISSFLTTPKADPRTSVAGFSCSSTKALSGTVLAVNFVDAMNNLSSLMNQNGYGTVISGEGPNAVYGLSQCFGDLNATDCILCFSEIRTSLPKCYPNNGGTIFLDGCFGRYQNFSFFHDTTDSKDSISCSVGTNNTSRVDLRKAVESVSSSAYRKNGFFAGTGYKSNPKVYVMAQCWENLDKKTCNSCLQTASDSIVSCSPAFEGRSLHAGCYIRYSDKLFWNPSWTSSSSGKPKSFWIKVGLSIGVLAVLTGIGIWILKRHLCRKKSRALQDSYGAGLNDAIFLSKLNFKYRELRKASNNFDVLNKLGQGSNGTVYKGVLSDGREVAVKRLFVNTRQWAEQFFNEVVLVSQLHHKNLVKLLGCSLDGPESLLVYQYYFNKSLDLFIFDEDRARLLNWEKRVSIIQGVAEGLYYLHDKSEIRIIHRDIKASNILLDDTFKPKITDFGLARSFTLDQTHLTTGVAGTLGYMAPEYVVHGHLTEKADVYSFGVLLLEIATGQRCNISIGTKSRESLLSKIWGEYKAKTAKRRSDDKNHEDPMEDEYLNIVRVGLLCTQATSSYRPTMARVVELLRNNNNEEVVSPTEPPFLDILEKEDQESGSPIFYWPLSFEALKDCLVARSIRDKR